MWIQDLFVSEFRNIQRAHMKPGPRWNVFFGKNAQGKTNILESIYFLSTLNSFRTKNIRELARHGKDVFWLRATIATETLPCELKAVFENGKKRYYINSENPVSMDKLIGFFPIVLFTNQNLDIVGQPPSELRRFLDVQLAQSIPEYLKTLVQYLKVLRFRNTLMKRRSTRELQGQLAVWTRKMLSLGAKIYEARRKAVKRLGIFARLLMKRISEENEEIDVRYAAQVEGEHEQELLKNYEARLAESFPKEAERGFTLVGPHRDTLGFLLNGKPADRFASAGQRKSIGIACKLAECENIKSFRRVEPAILLDEVFSELDEERKRNIVRLIRPGSQVFCTTAEKHLPEELGKKESVKVFAVSKGEVSEQ